MRVTFIAALLAATSACTTVTTGTSPAPPQAAAPHAYTAKEEDITEGVSWFQHITPDEAAEVEPFHNEDLMSPETDADPFIERYWNPTIQIRGSIAHVWAPYELRDNGKQIHCGIDAFDLVYLDGDWRVASIQSTMEPKACEALMPASPADMRPRDGWKETPNQ
jgi:hypothetical protein